MSYFTYLLSYLLVQFVHCVQPVHLVSFVRRTRT